MISRTTDHERWAAVLKHPAVEPSASLGQEVPDMAALVTNPANVLLMNEHGGFLFVNSGLGEYDVHTAFVPEGRGPHLVDVALEARRIMFEEIRAHTLRTFCADDNPAARRLALAAGFEDAHSAEIFGHRGSVMTMRKHTCQ